MAYSNETMNMAMATGLPTDLLGNLCGFLSLTLKETFKQEVVPCLKSSWVVCTESIAGGAIPIAWFDDYNDAEEQTQYQMEDVEEIPLEGFEMQEGCIYYTLREAGQRQGLMKCYFYSTVEEEEERLRDEADAARELELDAEEAYQELVRARWVGGPRELVAWEDSESEVDSEDESDYAQYSMY
jgi:hypothetical protein